MMNLSSPKDLSSPAPPPSCWRDGWTAHHQNRRQLRSSGRREDDDDDDDDDDAVVIEDLLRNYTAPLAEETERDNGTRILYPGSSSTFLFDDERKVAATSPARRGAWDDPAKKSSTLYPDRKSLVSLDDNKSHCSLPAPSINTMSKKSKSKSYYFDDDDDEKKKKQYGKFDYFQAPKEGLADDGAFRSSPWSSVPPSSEVTISGSSMGGVAPLTRATLTTLNDALTLSARSGSTDANGLPAFPKLSSSDDLMGGDDDDDDFACCPPPPMPTLKRGKHVPLGGGKAGRASSPVTSLKMPPPCGFESHTAYPIQQIG